MAKTPTVSHQKIEDLSEKVAEIVDYVDSIKGAMEVIKGTGLRIIEVEGWPSLILAANKLEVIAKALPINAKAAVRRAETDKANKKKG